MTTLFTKYQDNALHTFLMITLFFEFVSSNVRGEPVPSPYVK